MSEQKDRVEQVARLIEEECALLEKETGCKVLAIRYSVGGVKIEMHVVVDKEGGES